MKTIEITLDEPLLAEVDNLTAELHTDRSELFRDAVQLMLKRRRAVLLEAQHRQVYASQPQTKDELDEWLPEQAWEA